MHIILGCSHVTFSEYTLHSYSHSYLTFNKHTGCLPVHITAELCKLTIFFCKQFPLIKCILKQALLYFCTFFAAELHYKIQRPAYFKRELCFELCTEPIISPFPTHGCKQICQLIMAALYIVCTGLFMLKELWQIRAIEKEAGALARRKQRGRHLGLIRKAV